MIRFVEQTGSTNADLIAQLRGGEYFPEGDWLVANRQTQGRGRQGREWLDGAGNFMGSTVVHQRFGDPNAATLALLAGLTLHETLAIKLPPDTGLMLKWPNDVLAGDAKLAGILLEGFDSATIIGIGANLKSTPALTDRSAISLAQLGIEIDRDSFAHDLAKQFDLELERWRSIGLPPLMRRWHAAAHPVGTQLTVLDPASGPQTGEYAGLSSDAALKLRLADGTCRVIHAGEVLLGRGDE